MYAYSGILTALIQRGQSGRGGVIEVSMLEALAELVSQPYFYTEYGGQPPRRSGAEHASIAPYGPFPASDGTVFLGVQNEREFKAFCSDVLESPELFVDPRFQGNAARVVNRPALHEAINAVFATLRSKEVLQRLDGAGIANALLRTTAELPAHPRLTERRRWRNVESPVGLLRSLVHR